ncbi:MAG: Asp-tRNA(Asn)/Glu-tRNA(Gln) amidotransferase subunit GatA [Nitrospirae bacterium]|nr:MAG: Asp-tRNA(Asn)/Glu-tRNA(Gln) amidotransferase subunit GatA [Nitrospirota bacterium]
MSLRRMTLFELKDKFVKGEVSAVEIVKAYFQRIMLVESKIKAYITTAKRDALVKEANELDYTLSKWRKTTPLMAMPIAVKDNICTEGVKTTCGSRMLENFVPPYDATVVARMKEYGYYLIGKTNMDEFAMGSSTENSAFGPTRNPWNLAYIPGGSSGGSAAAVAAELCVAALGSDTGGSIRQPAACCGVVGLKPTYGRVSRYGLVAFASSLDQIGPVTKDVRDAAVMMQMIAGHDPLEEVELAVRTAIIQMQALKAEIKEISLPMTKYAIATYYLIATAEASSNLARYDGVKYGYRAAKEKGLLEMYMKTRQEGFGAEVKRRIMLGTYALSAGYYDAYYGKAQAVRTLIKRDFDEAFKAVDVIVTPTMPTPAFKLGEKIQDPLQMYLSDIYTISVNLAGVPAISLPCGLSNGKLPIGLQIIGRPFEEEKVLRAAYAYEQATEWHLKKPGL